jgi:uncharacterized membrane protein
VDPLQVLLRLLHVGLGVFWAGTLIFTAVLLLPALSDVGPDGAKVMAALQRRGMVQILPIVAIITMITGFWMYIRMAGGTPDWARSRVGMALGTGGLLAVIAFLIGIVVMRPTVNRITQLSATLAQLPEGPERSERIATVQRLRQRSARTGQIVALLLALTTALMAVARYL